MKLLRVIAPGLLFAGAGCGPAPPPLGECTVMGTAGDDLLIGTESADTICGSGGNDRLVGRGGNDRIVGGEGRDIINPGIGDDIVWGEDGNDSVFAFGVPGFPQSDVDKEGDDTVYLGEGRLQGAEVGKGNDVVYGGPGQDDIRGEDGDDRLYQGDSAYDNLNGGSGNDYISGHAGWLGMSGGPGHDVLFSVSPGGYVNARGGTGNDLAVLIDGTHDNFTAEDEPTVPFPSLGLPCNFAAGSETIEVGCELLPDLTISMSSDGDVTYSLPMMEVERHLMGLRGELAVDTCYCDIVPGDNWPFFEDTVM